MDPQSSAAGRDSTAGRSELQRIPQQHSRGMTITRDRLSRDI
jgi:hypothetical protein